MAFPTQSILLNGSSQYGSVADNAAFDTTTAYTVEAWLKIGSLPSTNTINFIFAKDDGDPNRSVEFYFRNIADTQSMGCLVSQDGTNATSNNYQINYTATTGAWHHFAWVLNIGAANEFEIFEDAVSKGTSAITETGIFSSSANVEVGAQKQGAGAASSFYNGRIGLMRVWKEARTSTQLSDNWCTVLGATTNLVAEWTFDNVLTDNSGNSLTLTDTGTMTFAADVTATCAVATNANFLMFM